MASVCIFYHHFIAKKPQTYYRKHHAIKALHFTISIFHKIFFSPQRNPIVHPNEYLSLKTVAEVDRIIYLEHKLWCHMSSCWLCYRPSPASSIGTGLPTLVSPAAQGLILLILLFFQNHSKLCQALTKEAREINPAL